MTLAPPAARGLHHIGLTVPDLGEATRFLVDHLGCEACFTTPSDLPATPAEAAKLNIAAGAELRGIAMLRARGVFIELFEYRIDGQRLTPPANTDIGAAHLAFEVDGIEAAAARLERAGARLCGGVNQAKLADFSGLKWLYFVAPWGQTFELVEVSEAPQFQLGNA